jgi:cellulose biosynthesis protein BcsQ
VGKTTVAALTAGELVARGRATLAVDCDPNPNLAESFAHDSRDLDRFGYEDGLRRVGPTLELAREPRLIHVAEGLWLLGGPPTSTPLADALARGIAGVLLADRFDAVVTDLGAGPELAHAAVGGVLNPADLCAVLTRGSPSSDLAAERIEAACRARQVEYMRVLNPDGAPDVAASALVETASAKRNALG